MNWLFPPSSQSITVSASVLQMNIQGWFPLGLTGLISLQSKRLSSVFSSTTVQKHQFFSTQPSLWSNSHIYTWLLESHNFNYTDFCWQSNVSAFYYTKLVIAFLPRSKSLLISWLQSPSAVILEPPKIKSDTVFPFISHEVIGPDAMIFVFWMLNVKPTFSLFSFTFIKRLFSSSSLSAIRVVSSAYMLLLLSHFSRVRLCATP